jgi:hypothetical protein
MTGIPPAAEKTGPPPEKKEEQPTKAEDSGLSPWWYILGLALVLVPLSVVLVRRRKRSAAPEPEAPGSPEPPTLFRAGESGPTAVLPGVSPTAPRPAPVSLRVELAPTGTRDTGGPLKATVTDRLVLGRSGGPSGLAIPGDATISARHCELVFSKGRLFVCDLQSSNGTMVNGVPIQGNYPLEDGDRLTLGKTELRIRILGLE